jgi:hypothetical protein
MKQHESDFLPAFNYSSSVSKNEEKWGVNIYLEGFLFKFRERVSCKPQLEQSLVPETSKIVNFIPYTEKKRRATTSEESTDQNEQQDPKRGPKHEPSCW